MKKMKKLLSLTAIGMLAVFGLAQPAAAAESEVNIQFTPGTGTPPVVDPEDPTQPFEPGDPEDDPTNEAGSLTLDYVSSVNFGINQIEASTEIYESTTLRPFIQVTDRRGTGEGWNVTAQASSFITVEEEEGEEGEEATETLTGSIITFANGEVDSISNSAAPTPANSVQLHTGGEAAQVVNAPADTGMGSWINRWFPTVESEETNDSVTLEVPAGSATIGNHAATITWTLTDAPGQ